MHYARHDTWVAHKCLFMTLEIYTINMCSHLQRALAHEVVHQLHSATVLEERDVKVVKSREEVTQLGIGAGGNDSGNYTGA